MIVFMTRANCVGLYDELVKLPGCPEIRIVMTGDLGEDPPEWSAAGHLTTKAKREAIKKRMIDVDDPLQIVIVFDMWLTGTDIPCLHTLYIDKPMKGHSEGVVDIFQSAGIERADISILDDNFLQTFKDN